MRRVIFAGVALAFSAIGLAAAQGTSTPGTAGGLVGTPDALILGRQAGMDLQGAVTGELKRAVDGKAEVKTYKSAADAIAAWGRAIPGMFPAGTEHGHDTKALPAVWSDRAGFEKASATLTTAAEKMSQAAAADDKAAFAEAFQATAQACGACHRSFRAR